MATRYVALCLIMGAIDMRKLNVKLTDGTVHAVEAQVFTVHIPPWSGASKVSWQFFYYVAADGVGVVAEKVGGARFNTFQPVATTKEGRTKEARAAVERRLSQYGCETVTYLLKRAALTPIN